jgi:glycosyltransferase involved in cell wall biosynthesis
MASVATVEEALMARLLALTSRLPYPPCEGHQLRSWHLLRALASRHEVTLLCFRRADEPLHIDVLRDTFAAVETFPIPAEHSRPALVRALARGLLTPTPFVAAKYTSPALRERLAALARDADLVHVDMLPLMANTDCVPVTTPLVLNAHNVEHQLLEQRVRMTAGPLRRTFLGTQCSKLQDFERSACRRATAVLACSTTDADSLRALAPGTDVHVVPNGVDLDALRPAPHPGGARIAFVGQMGWFPNRDGVEWFLHDILPRILASRPDASFVVIGKHEGLQVPDGLATHVRLAGFVPDLRPLLHGAAIYVVPLRVGSGTRLKVLEAMALGKAIVTTSVGSEGIALRDGQSALFADDAGTFADAVIGLLDSPGTCGRLGAAARTCVEARYGWDAIGTGLRDLYATMLSSAPAMD